MLYTFLGMDLPARSKSWFAPSLTSVLVPLLPLPVCKYVKFDGTNVIVVVAVQGLPLDAVVDSLGCS